VTDSHGKRKGKAAVDSIRHRVVENGAACVEKMRMLLGSCRYRISMANIKM